MWHVDHVGNFLTAIATPSQEERERERKSSRSKMIPKRRQTKAPFLHKPFPGIDQIKDLLGYTTSDFHCENSQVPQNSQIFLLSNAHSYVDETNTQNRALQALSRGWIASNGLENLSTLQEKYIRECLLIMHYELAEKGPIRVSCGKCLSGRSRVRRLALVY